MTLPAAPVREAVGAGPVDEPDGDAEALPELEAGVEVAAVDETAVAE